MFRRAMFAFGFVLTLIALTLAAAPAPAPAAPAPAAAKTVTVTMQGHQFVDPSSNTSTTTINVGDSVQWTAASGGPHTATADDSPRSFDTGFVRNGETSKLVTFTKAGAIPYHCEVHGASMSGSIIVK